MPGPEHHGCRKEMTNGDHQVATGAVARLAIQPGATPHQPALLEIA
jgi:hypothetical protein